MLRALLCRLVCLVRGHADAPPCPPPCPNPIRYCLRCARVVDAR